MPFFDIPEIWKTGLKIFWAYFFQDFVILHLMSFNRFSRFKWQIFNFQVTQRLAVTWPCKGQLDFLLCFFQLPFLILSDDFQSAIVKLDDLVKDLLLYSLLCSFLYCITIIHHIVRDVNTLFCIYYIKLLWTILCKSHKNVIDIWAICTNYMYKLLLYEFNVNV